MIRIIKIVNISFDKKVKIENDELIYANFNL